MADHENGATNTSLEQAAKEISRARQCIALTGAGISVDSGIPPFRGAGGVWEKVNPMEFGHIDFFMRDPKTVWEVLLKDLKITIGQAEPNDGHKGLAELERLGYLDTIITQNVDGLHQAAGSTDVIEFHGTCAWMLCLDCGNRIKTGNVSLETLPPTCACGGILRPDWIFFGESIPSYALERSTMLAGRCDMILVVGTSAIVHPAASIPMIAKQRGARVIEINPERTPLTENRVSDYLLQGKAGDILNRLLAVLRPDAG
ncbi:MAG: RNA polymerase subunit sigma [Desulfobacterales bacterium]|nr:MAG: RNA polymerase subunit sigma [Desulfobacterales bacterium]